MTKTIITTMVLAIALSLAPTIAQAGTVTLTNPGFESATFPDGWTVYGTTWQGAWSGQYHTGTNSLAAADVSGTNAGAGGFQDFTLPNLTDQYTFNGWVKTVGLTGGNAHLKLEWWDNSNNKIGTTLQSTNLNGTNAWTQLLVSGIPVAGAAKGRIVYEVVGGASGQDAFFDDSSVTYDPIPEPASMLLLGSGLVGLFGISRRKK